MRGYFPKYMVRLKRNLEMKIRKGPLYGFESPLRFWKFQHVFNSSFSISEHDLGDCADHRSMSNIARTE